MVFVDDSKSVQDSIKSLIDILESSTQIDGKNCYFDLSGNFFINGFQLINSEGNFESDNLNKIFLNQDSTIAFRMVSILKYLSKNSIQGTFKNPQTNFYFFDYSKDNLVKDFESARHIIYSPSRLTSANPYFEILDSKGNLYLIKSKDLTSN